MGFKRGKGIKKGGEGGGGISVWSLRAILVSMLVLSRYSGYFKVTSTQTKQHFFPFLFLPAVSKIFQTETELDRL